MQRRLPLLPQKEQEIGRSYAWKSLSPLGLREEADMDTLSLNLPAQRAVHGERCLCHDWKSWCRRS